MATGYYTSRWASLAARSSRRCSPRRRRARRDRRVRLPLRPSRARGHARERAGRRPAAGARRAAHRLDHRHPPQPLVSHEDVARAVSRADGRAARPHRARRRLRDLGRSPVRRRRPPKRSRRSSAPHGVFGILGNHDDDHDMPAALGRERRPGAEGRADAADDPRRDRSIWSASASGPSARPTSRALMRGAAPTTILLAHDPRRLTEAAALDVPLVLVGPHARRPGRAAAGRRHRRAEVSGGRRHRPPRRTTMFVSRGVGTVYVPVRINCPPEVAVLTLQPA